MRIYEPLTVENSSITKYTNQSIGNSNITPFAFFRITKKWIRYPNTIDQGVMQSNFRRFCCPICAGIIQSWIIPWLTEDQIGIIILEKNKIRTCSLVDDLINLSYHINFIDSRNGINMNGHCHIACFWKWNRMRDSAKNVKERKATYSVDRRRVEYAYHIDLN